MAILNGSTVAGTNQCLSSLRQRCLLSIHLYALFLEPLLCRLHRDLKGISMFNRTVTTRACVDDLATFTGSDTDILRGVQVLQDFCSSSSQQG
jgi:hypothetical protein